MREERVPLPEEGRDRVRIAHVAPQIDCGRYAIKRCVGDVLEITADLVCDGHDRVAGVARLKRPNEAEWLEVPLEPEPNDRYRARFALDAVGRWEIAVEAWIDPIASMRAALEAKIEAKCASDLDLRAFAELVRRTAERAGESEDARAMNDAIDAMEDRRIDPHARARRALEIAPIARAYDPRSFATRSEPWSVVVDPVHARFAAWYELFPRSTGSGKHGTFSTAAARLPYLASMGFDVVYLPPIHPIGLSHRKGRDNALHARAEDPGSPWAIGAREGGHTAIHPALGTLADFDRFVQRASEHGIKVALDIAFQASPDHPWVIEHPSWFARRPDGSIQYAENPPKKYQDVYPFDFASPDWKNLWRALRDVFLFWIDRGVTIFRVDNPHTKPTGFWEWCIASIKRVHPEATFLAEAFTRPKLKYALAKAGFSQGYTYFTWRHTKDELTEYFTELARTEVAEYFRPSLWPNTPDILPEELQFGGRAAFVSRLVMAGTLSSHYGIYGPPFELMEHLARPHSDDYANNEKYEIRDWDLEAEHSLRGEIARLNTIRREHPALWRNDSLRFHPSDSDALLAYSKREGEDRVLAIVCLDPHQRRSGSIELDLEALGIGSTESYLAQDLFTDERHIFRGRRIHIEIDPARSPVRLFALRTRIRREQDFDYFL